MDITNSVVRLAGTWADAAPLALLQAPAIKRLPGAPLHERLLLESPWPLVVFCGVAGVVAMMALRSRGRGRAGVAALAAAALVGAAVWGLAGVVRTDREILRSQSLELVNAVAIADLGTLERLLAEDVVAVDPRSPRERDKGAIMSQVADLFGQHGTFAIKEHRVLEMEAVLDGPRVGRTQVRTSVVPEQLGAPVGSWWRVDWRRDEPGGWRVVGVTPLWVQGLRLAE